MKMMVDLHSNEYINPLWNEQIGTAQLPAPIYTVGSWNEEFEGHAVFPAGYNASLLETHQSGFDMAFAIKQVFGWNHYATRPILPPAPPTEPI
jgi:hypothetical protein